MSKDQIEEFGKYFEELESPLIAYAYQIIREIEDARDQVHEAFRRMILREEIIEQPKAWLYRTVRNFASAIFVSIKECSKREKIDNSIFLLASLIR